MPCIIVAGYPLTKGSNTVESQRNRLAEITEEAKALIANDEIDFVQKRDQLKALKDERTKLEAEIEAAALAVELTAETPKESAEDSKAEAKDDTPTKAEAETAEPEAKTDAPAEAEAEKVEAEKPTEDEPKVEITNEKVAEAVAASAAPDTPKVDAEKPEWRPTLTASANVDGMRAGADMTVRDFQRVHRNAVSMESGRQVFAHLSNIPEGVGVVSELKSATENTAILAAAQPVPQAITAASSHFCGPDEAIMDIATCGLSDRSVQALFRTVGVSGRFRYIKALGISDVSGGIKVWEESDQLAVDPDDPATWKPCVDLACQSEITVTPYNVTQCGTLSQHQQLSNPNLVDNFIGQLGVAYARSADQKLLDTIVAGSRVFDIDAAVVGTNSLLNTIEFILGQLAPLKTYQDRIGGEGYVLAVADGTLEALLADQHLRGGGQEAEAKAQIIARIEEVSGASVEVIRDVHSAAEAAYNTAAAALPALGTPTAWAQGTNNVATHPMYYFKPDSYRVGMSEVVEAGFIRDAQLTRRNEVQYFFESGEFLEKVSCEESFVLNVTGCPSGVATAPDAAPAC